MHSSQFRQTDLEFCSSCSFVSANRLNTPFKRIQVAKAGNGNLYLDVVCED